MSSTLSTVSAMVVQADDGMDEISVCSPTQVAELRDGSIQTYSISPQDFGMPVADVRSIQVGGADGSLAMIKSVLANEQGAAHDIVCLNAGAAVYVADGAATHTEGVEKARAAIAGGAAAKTLQKLIDVSNA